MTGPQNRKCGKGTSKVKRTTVRKSSWLCSLAIASALGITPIQAQDQLPYDNGMSTYHTAPRYRESESHPLRVLSYIVHPIGWVLREGIFRPLSYFASSTETRKSVMGYREPFDYRRPECFSPDDSAPDCRSIMPFNYDTITPAGEEAVDGDTASDTTKYERQVYLPDVNFDFDKKQLNELGEGRAHQIARMLKESPGVKIVLQGHTDYLGTEEYNEKLGMDRAETVRQKLIELGASPESLSTVSFGKTEPALADQENWARAVNRRVEVHVDQGGTAAETTATEESKKVEL